MTAVSGIGLEAGTVDITPGFPVPLFGRSGRPNPVSKVKSRLEANCLVLFDQASRGAAAIVALDTLYPSKRLADAILSLCAEKGLAIASDRLLLIASHTHNAPALDDTKPMLGGLVADYLAFAAGRVAECLVGLADASAEEAKRAVNRFEYGQTECPGAVFRRRQVAGVDVGRFKLSRRLVMAPNPSVKIDQTLQLLLVKDSGDTLRAVLWSWPCHAVSEPESDLLSADFPGAIRDELRRAVGDPALPVLYLPGFSGDIRPLSKARLPVHRFGSWLGFGTRFAKLGAAQLDQFHKAVAQGFFAAMRKATPCERQDVGLRCIRRSMAVCDIRTEGSALAPLTCDDWDLGPFRITAVSAEVASAYGNRSEAATPTFRTGCAGQVFGYLPTDSQLAEGGYEARDFAPSFSVPGRFHSTIEPQIAQLIGT